MDTDAEIHVSSEIDLEVVVEKAGVKGDITLCALVSMNGDLISSTDPDIECMDIYAAMAATVYGAAEIATLDTDESIKYIYVELEDSSMVLRSLNGDALLMCTLREKDLAKKNIVDRIAEQLGIALTE